MTHISEEHLQIVGNHPQIMRLAISDTHPHNWRRNTPTPKMETLAILIGCLGQPFATAIIAGALDSY